MNTVVWLREGLARRPLWMNAILLFCAYMTFIYLPWDIFIKPLKVDQEVWFGVLFTGWAAKGWRSASFVCLRRWHAGLVAHAQLAAAVDEPISVADCVRHGLLGINRSARQ